MGRCWNGSEGGQTWVDLQVFIAPISAPLVQHTYTITETAGVMSSALDPWMGQWNSCAYTLFTSMKLLFKVEKFYARREGLKSARAPGGSVFFRPG